MSNSILEEQVVSDNAKNAAVSWTGGKDCNLALLKAWRNPAYRVTCLVVFCPPEARFRAHPLPLMRAQASSLSLPFRSVVFPQDAAKDYKQAYIDGIQSLTELHGVEVIVTGDMDLVGSMQRNWIEECVESVPGASVYLPLWKADRESILGELVEEGFHVIFSCVKTPYFDASWIGRTLDLQRIQAIQKLCQSQFENVKPLDLGGENGEYHTMCVNGPLYRSRVKVDLTNEPIEVSGQRGQKEGERWWVINSAS